jgi:hypothetical protein
MPTVLTLASKQRRMMDFYNKENLNDDNNQFKIYLAVGFSDEWPLNKPRVPLETDDLTTYNTLIYGYQAYKEVLFARVIQNPTEEQKETCIYYQDCYYETISNHQQALEEGYTRIMLRWTLDKDEYFPVDDGQGGSTMYNVLGMYIDVNTGDIDSAYFISTEDWNNRVEDQGTLELISTRSVISRSADQSEDITILLEF